MDTELNSDTPAASREIGRQSEAGEPSQAGDPPVDRPPLAIASSDAATINPLRDALAALDRKDYATAKRLFEALGRKDAAEAIEKALAALDRKDYATAQGLFEALAPPKPAAPTKGPIASDPRSANRHQSDLPPINVVPFADSSYRQPAPPAQKAKRRGLKRVFVGAALMLLLLLALYGPRLDGPFAAVKGQAIAGVGLALDFVKTSAAAVTGQSGREEERSAMRDLSASLTQATIRLDQIEHEYGARLDKLEEPVEQSAAVKSVDMAPAPAAPTAEFAKVAARVDVLEKKVADPAPPASEFADVTTRLNDITTRLDRLEKKAAVAAPGASELADVVKRLDRLEKTVAAPVAGSAKPVPPPKPSTLMARADPFASNEIAKPDAAKPLLRDYVVGGVQGGVAVVDSRYGPQEVSPGDFIPGAGRVLKIEKRGGSWVVVTSRGVIASGQAPY